MGLQGLIDRRRVAFIQVASQCYQILNKRIFGQALDGLADDGGLWNGRAFADWVAQLTGKPIHRQRGWEYLRSGGDKRPQTKMKQGL